MSSSTSGCPSASHLVQPVRAPSADGLPRSHLELATSRSPSCHGGRLRTHERLDRAASFAGPLGISKNPLAVNLMCIDSVRGYVLMFCRKTRKPKRKAS